MQENEPESGGSSVQIGRDNIIHRGIGYREISRMMRGLEIAIIATSILFAVMVGAVIYGQAHTSRLDSVQTIQSINLIDNVLHVDRSRENPFRQKKSLSC